MINFDTFTKIALECGRFGQVNCCQRLKKLAQSPINRPIWSDWWVFPGLINWHNWRFKNSKKVTPALTDIKQIVLVVACLACRGHRHRRLLLRQNRIGNRLIRRCVWRVFIRSFHGEKIFIGTNLGVRFFKKSFFFRPQWNCLDLVKIIRSKLTARLKAFIFAARLWEF